MQFRSASAVAGLALAATGAVAALPDEIQVYTNDINKPGEFGLELHVNATPSGRSTPDFPREVPPAHGWRFTPEFSYGLGPSLEGGLYLPFVHGAGGPDLFAGPKLRLKWMPLRTDAEGNGSFAGLNVEYAWVNDRLELATRAMELRPIIGWRDAEWLVAANPILGVDFAGPEKGKRPAFSPSAKVSRRVIEGVDAGFEYYGDFGPVRRFAPRAERSHSLYLAFDIDKPIAFNVGVGRGWNAADRWTVKFIFEIPL